MKRVLPSALLGAALTLGLPALLGGCGFQPLYGSNGRVGVAGKGADAASMNARLSEVYVNTIPERSGQLTRQALQARLGGDGDSENQKYRLTVNVSMSPEVIGIHGDNSAGRMRVSGDARWYLITVATKPVLVATGHTRALDGYNIEDEQYFASTLAGEATNARLAQLLADGVVQQLAVWFRAHPEGTAATAVTPPPKHDTSTPPRPGFLVGQPVPGDNGDTSTEAPGADGMPSGALGLPSSIGTH